MKTLLYATDLTSRADRALERACRIAIRQRAKLHIVYVATSSAEDLAARNKELDDQIKEQLIEIAGPDAALPDYVIHADIGDPVRMIVAKIAELDPDLAVLGQSDDVAATRAPRPIRSCQKRTIPFWVSDVRFLATTAKQLWLLIIRWVPDAPLNTQCSLHPKTR